MKNKAFYLVFLILGFSAFISVKSYLPSRSAGLEEAQMAAFPKIVGEWASKDIELSKRDYEILETRNLIMRDYSSQAGERINLYIIYSKDNRKVAHPPEICLQGAGAEVLNKSTLQISDSLRAIKLVMQKVPSKEIVVYWYRVGKFNTSNYLAQQIKQVIEKIRGKDAPVAMIRLVASVENHDEEDALKRIKLFCSLIEPLLEEYVP